MNINHMSDGIHQRTIYELPQANSCLFEKTSWAGWVLCFLCLLSFSSSKAQDTDKDQLCSKMLKTDNYDDYETEMGICSIDGITYRLRIEYGNYRARIMPYNQTGCYKGDIYIPDSINYDGQTYQVYWADFYAFDNCPELTSLSIGVPAQVTSCPRLKNLEIRPTATTWEGIAYCDSLERVVFPESMNTIYVPNYCPSLREIRFASARRLKFVPFNGENWNNENLPSLTDIYFATDFPPEFCLYESDEQMVVPQLNANLHIPKGTIEEYKQSIWGHFSLMDDQPNANLPGVKWDYCGYDEDCRNGFIVGCGNNDVEYAMYVPASHLTAYKGCRITKIEFYAPVSGNDQHFQDVEYVFITTPNVDYLVKEPLGNFQSHWNTVELSEPYTITGDQLYVGCGRNGGLWANWANFKEIENAFYIRVMGRDNAYIKPGVWLNMNTFYDNWNHPIAIRFYIEGDNLPADVLISSLTATNETQAVTSDATLASTPKYVKTSAMDNRKYFALSLNNITENLNFETSTPRKAILHGPMLSQDIYGKTQFQVTVRSRTINTITGISFDWSIDSTYFGKQNFETFILPNHEKTFIIPMPDSINNHQHKFYINVAEVNEQPDAIADNSCESINFTTPANVLFPRRIVMEEATATWCEWCPSGIATIQKATEKYPENFIAIALHNDEFYSHNSSCDTLLNQFPSIPNSRINRTTKLEPDWWPLRDIIEMNKDNAEVKIDATAELTTRDSVSITSEITFGYSDNGSVENRIAYVVLEDKVGPSLQANIFSYPDFVDYPEDSPNSYLNWWYHQEPYVETLFNNVARGYYPCLNGISGAVPTVIREGETYVYTYKLRLPDNIQNLENISIATLIINGITGEILNAAMTPVSIPLDITLDINNISCSEKMFDVFSITGMLVRRQTNTLSGLPAGIYVVKGKKIAIKN